jgi:drug/metabolite transporter (DMT)-like permease
MRRAEGRTAGIAMMLSSAVLFSVMSLLIRSAQGVDSFLTSFVRFAVGAAVVGTFALAGRMELRFVNKPILLLRGLLGGIAVYLFFLSINKIGMARGSVISNSFPLFATLGSAVLLKEKVKPVSWLFLGMTLVGVVLLGGNGTLFSWDLWYVISFFGAVLAGLAIVCIRVLTRTDGPNAIFMSQSLVGFWIVIVPAFGRTSALDGTTAFILLGIGLCAAAAQLLMTKAYEYLEVSTGSLLNMLTPLINVIIGALVFHETLGVQALVGIALILGSCAFIIRIGKVPVLEGGE